MHPNNQVEPELNINFDSLLKQGFAVIDVRYRDYEIAKEPFKYVIIRIEGDRDDFYPSMIKHYLGIEKRDKDLFDLWIKILKHKLKMSKLLNRDISIKVAALDYIETSGIEL